MLSGAFRKTRRLLSHADIFGAPPELKVRDKDKSLSITIISSLIFYTLTVILLNQQLMNLFEQSSTETLTTTDSHNTEFNWTLGKDLNLSIKFERDRGAAEEQLQLWVENTGKSLKMERRESGRGWVYELNEGNLLLRGWKEKGKGYSGAKVRVEDSDRGRALVAGRYSVTIQAMSFDKDYSTPQRREVTFRKKPSPSSLSVSISGLVSTTDNSSSPYPTRTQQSGVLLSSTSSWLPASQSPTLLFTLSLTPLTTVYTYSSPKLHRYISNIGNFLTTLVLIWMFIFVEFNFMNKYTRVCEDMYIIKYQEDGRLIYQKIQSGVWDWMLPIRRAFRIQYGIKERLKLKAVQEVKREFDVGRMVRRVRTLEKIVEDEPTVSVVGLMEKSVASRSSTKSKRSMPSTIPSSIPSQSSFPSSLSFTNPQKLSSLLSISSVGPASEPSTSSISDPSSTTTLSQLLNENTIRQFTKPPPPSTDDTASSMINQSMAESEVAIRAKEGKDKRKEKFKRISKWFWKGLDNFLTEIDFFAYDVNFNYDENRSAVTSEVSGIFTLLAFWFTFAIMLIDIISFAKSDHFVSSYVQSIDSCQKDLELTNPYFMMYAVNTTTGLVEHFQKVKNKTDFELYLKDQNFSLGLTQVSSSLPDETVSALLKLPFLKSPSDIQLGYCFNLSSRPPVSLSCSQPLTFNVTFLYPNTMSQVTFVNLTLYFVSSSQQLDTTNNKFLNDFEAIPWNYNPKFWLQHQSITLQYDTIHLHSDSSAAPLDLQKSYSGYQMNPAETKISFQGKTKLYNSEQAMKVETARGKYEKEVQFEHKTSFVLTKSKKAEVYSKVTVKADEFVGNLGGVFFFGLYFVSIIGGFFNRIKMECNLGNIFEKERLEFRWKYVFLAMFPKWIKRMLAKCFKMPPIGRYKQKGEEVLQLDELCKRIDKLQKYSTITATPIQKQFSKIYIKESSVSTQATQQSNISMRSTLSYPSGISSGNSRILQRDQNYKDVIVRNEPQIHKTGKFRKVWEKLSYFDMLDSSVHMHFKGKSKVSSGFTQALSIILIILLFILFRSYINTYMVNARASISQSTFPISFFTVDEQFLNQFKMSIMFKHFLNGSYSPLQSSIDLRLYAANKLIPFGQVYNNDTHQMQISLNKFALQNLTKNMLQIELSYASEDSELDDNLIRDFLMKYEMSICMTNFKFNPTNHQSVNSSFDCSNFMTVPYFTPGETVISVRNIQQQVGKYEFGFFKSSKTSNYYTVDFTNSFKRFKLNSNYWKYSFVFEFSEQATQYISSPSNLDSIVNKLTGAIGFCIFFLLYLKLINKTKFVLELSLQLYLTEITEISFCDCLKVLFFLHTPNCLRCLAWPRTLTLLDLYQKTFKQLSLKSFLQRLKLLQDKIYNNLGQQSKSILKVHLKSQVWKQDNLDAARDREIRTWKRELENVETYKYLKKTLGLSEEEALTIMEVLANEQAVSQQGLRRKLASLKSRLPAA